jgi:hypothetical protein
VYSPFLRDILAARMKLFELREGYRLTQKGGYSNSSMDAKSDGRGDED